MIKHGMDRPMEHCGYLPQPPCLGIAIFKILLVVFI